MKTPSAFNARNSSPQEVISSFVVPEHFEQIAGFQNLILVGPRGIGKTTIMKALTSSGIYYLSQRDSTEELDYIRGTSYLPIYVPAETIWKGTAKLISEAVSSEANQFTLLNGMFVDHCLHQVVTSIQDACDVGSKFSNEQLPPWALRIEPMLEEKICRQLSDFWELDRIQTSFVGLKLALLRRSNSYRSTVNSFKADRPHVDPSKFVRLDVLTMLKGLFDVLEDACGVRKWSVNFDEMEIAPKQVLATLYENLRSFDQRAVLKFSLFPYMDFYGLEERTQKGAAGPVDGQDFHTVVLTNKFANPNFDFSRRLVRNECEKRGIKLTHLQRYLDSSNAIHFESRIFKQNGFQRRFENVFSAAVNNGDRDFIQYMAKSGVSDVFDVDKIKGEKKRAQYIRKIAPVVEFRNYYFSRSALNARQDPRRASWKGFGYYHGYEQLLNITESNPRAIKYYVNELLASLTSNEDSKTAQNRAISRNVDRFRALIASQAVTVGEQHHRPLPTLEVVDRMGQGLSDEILDVRFRPEPALSYRLKNIEPNARQAIVVGINSGALVVDSHNDGNQLISEVDGCRVRLSHRLAPFFPLPTITGQSKVISNLPDKDAKYSQQPDLLSWVTNG